MSTTERWAMYDFNIYWPVYLADDCSKWPHRTSYGGEYERVRHMSTRLGCKI